MRTCSRLCGCRCDVAAAAPEDGLHPCAALRLAALEQHFRMQHGRSSTLHREKPRLKLTRHDIGKTLCRAVVALRAPVKCGSHDTVGWALLTT